MQALVIVPTYNERQNLEPFIHSVLEVKPRLHLLVVDDNSPDGTGEVAEKLASRDWRIRVLHREGKQGLGTAYRVGFKYALARSYDLVLQMDADFSHRPKDLPLILRAAESADVVIGSRGVSGGRVENWSAVRRFISKGGSLYSRAVLGLPIKDCTSGFKCFHRGVLETISYESIQSNGYAFQVEMNYLCHRAGFRIAEVPIVFADRTAGSSKMYVYVNLPGGRQDRLEAPEAALSTPL